MNDRLMTPETADLTAEALRKAGALPRALPHFAHITRYWDGEHRQFAARLLPGEYYVSISGEVITTLLGSCISACIRDKILGIGGMNHFMLPNDASHGTSAWASTVGSATRYGNVAMDKLIGDILQLGGKRENLEVKLVGGAQVMAGNLAADIGARNSAFIHQFLKDQGLPILAEDLGDVYPRKVQYFPRTGVIRVKKVAVVRNDALIERENRYAKNLGRDA